MIIFNTAITARLQKILYISLIGIVLMLIYSEYREANNLSAVVPALGQKNVSVTPAAKTKSYHSASLSLPTTAAATSSDVVPAAAAGTDASSTAIAQSHTVTAPGGRSELELTNGYGASSVVSAISSLFKSVLGNRPQSLTDTITRAIKKELLMQPIRPISIGKLF